MDAHAASVKPGLLRRSAEVAPDAPALAGPGRPALTYGELYDQTIAVAGRLGREHAGALCVRGRRARVRLLG